MQLIPDRGNLQIRFIYIPERNILASSVKLTFILPSSHIFTYLYTTNLEIQIKNKYLEGSFFQAVILYPDRRNNTFLIIITECLDIQMNREGNVIIHYSIPIKVSSLYHIHLSVAHPMYHLKLKCNLCSQPISNSIRKKKKRTSPKAVDCLTLSWKKSNLM